jgi:hypothetical protein
MSKLPRVTGKQLIATLARAGFSVVRTRAVIIFCDIPMDAQRSFQFIWERPSAPACLTKILRDIDLRAEQLNKMLR